MKKVYVPMEDMKEYKWVVLLDRPGIVYVNVAADKNAKLAIVVPNIEGKLMTS